MYQHYIEAERNGNSTTTQPHGQQYSSAMAGKTFKLCYFERCGRGEVSSQLFCLGDTEYQDVKYPAEEWWTKYKAETPFGSCPVLHITDANGKTIEIAQSHAITRYLARSFGYNGHPGDLIEQARVEMMADAVEDYIVKPALILRKEQDPDTKAAMTKKYVEEQLPTALKNLQAQMDLNTSNSGWLVGNSLTWADLTFAHWLRWLTIQTPVTAELLSSILAPYPKLQAVCDNVANHPKIKNWLEAHPKYLL